MHACPHCNWSFTTLQDLSAHTEIRHNDPVPVQLMVLYLDAQRNPDDQGKRLAYFESLAGARLNDYYELRDDLKAVWQRIDAIKQLSDVGLLFDGADHLNEFTHEANEKHITAALDRIHRIATGEENPE